MKFNKTYKTISEKFSGKPAKANLNNLVKKLESFYSLMSEEDSAITSSIYRDANIDDVDTIKSYVLNLKNDIKSKAGWSKLNLTEMEGVLSALDKNFKKVYTIVPDLVRLYDFEELTDKEWIDAVVADTQEKMRSINRSDSKLKNLDEDDDSDELYSEAEKIGDINIKPIKFGSLKQYLLTRDGKIIYIVTIGRGNEFTMADARSGRTVSFEKLINRYPEVAQYLIDLHKPADEEGDGETETVEENFNQEGYTTYVIVDGKIDSGWYNEDEAKSHADDMPPEHKAKIVSGKGVREAGLDPNNEEDWLGGEVLDEKMKKNQPKNCSECKFSERDNTYCKKNKESIGPYDWCAAGRKK